MCTHQHVLWMTLWHVEIGSRCTFKLSWKTSLKGIVSWSFFGAKKKKCFKCQLYPKSWGVGVKRKRKSDCHAFPTELMVLKVSQFYKHTPSLAVWLVKHFLCLCLAVSHADSVSKCHPTWKYLIAGWGSFCPSPLRISSSHSKPLHCCLSHQVSLVQTEYISCRLIFLPLHFLNNNSLNLMSSLISVYSPHTCFVKSEKLIEVNEGKKAPSCHFIVTNPHTHTHTCTHAQTNITLVATRVLCCITDRAQKRLYRDIWMLHSCHEGLSCGATFY